MASKKRLIAGLVLSTLFTLSAGAAEDAALSTAERAAIVQTLAAKIKSNYIVPAVAERVANMLVKKHAEGGYASAASAKTFSGALSKDLREFSADKHFRATHDPRFRERSSSDLPGGFELTEQQVAQGGFGILKVERLPGNIGYIELFGIGPTEFVGPAYSAAIALVAGSEALILDLRRHSGGRPPASVAYLMSHFFQQGDMRHLNDIYDRPSDKTRQYWTTPVISQRYDKPVYVLTSAGTFSAGEETAYHFQTQKRGTLVGETTGGGANPVNRFTVGSGLVVAIPTAQVSNPVTKTSWERVGITPDIAVPAAQALQTAHAAILRNLLSSARDDQQRNSLQRTLSMVEKGETETPVYTLRQ